MPATRWYRWRCAAAPGSTAVSRQAVGAAWLGAAPWRRARRTARLGVSAAAAVLLTALGGGLLGWSGAAVGAVAGLLTARAIGWGSHSLKEITWAERLDRAGF